MSEPTITPWKKYKAPTIDLDPADYVTSETRINAFQHKQIPQKDAAVWEDWSAGSDGKYNFDDSSTLRSGQQLQFTYMQTKVQIPTDYALTEFKVTFSHVDDGARIFVFNSDYIDGKFDPTEVLYGENMRSVDLKDWVKKGEENRVVVVQFDMSQFRNTLKNLQIEVNGSPVAASAPGGTSSPAAAPRLGSLRLVSSTTEPTEPGAGSPVVLDDKPSVELIIDASGSMTYNMEVGKSRWSVAKEVLTKVINEDLNTSMHVALRVFGPSGLSPENETKIERSDNQNTGYTTLLQPLAPLDKSALQSQIEGIRPSGATPIADSIEKVEDDLQDARGQGARSVVVLITDGNENCGGNVLNAINTLKASGVEVVLNVVGFAIQDPNLKARFTTWANAGSGNYYDATDRELFEQELISAINVSYFATPLNGQGGHDGFIDGPAIDIAPGQYFIMVDPEDRQYMKNIGVHEIRAGEPKVIAVERWGS
ncbi:MAG: VWA domain-containing protein [Anaerolineales bacterium]|nr:VWA domain-containing protein [Anaerolineales bacterium]